MKGKKLMDKEIKKLREIYQKGYTMRQTADRMNLSYDIVFRYTRNITRGHKGRKAWNKGISCSEKTKKKISKILKQKYKEGIMVNWNKGLTKETDERLKKKSESRKGYKASEETKRKMSLARKGKKQKPYSDEAKRNKKTDW